MDFKEFFLMTDCALCLDSKIKLNFQGGSQELF